MATGPVSMIDGLTSMLTNLASMEVAADADPDFLNNLRSLIASKIRETQAADLTSQANSLAPMPSPTGPSATGVDMSGAPLPLEMSDPAMMPTPGGMGMSPTPGGPMPGAMGAGAPGPGRGFSPAPAIPDPDSLRRILNVG